MNRTTVINLFGGPGSGKSTTAAAVFAELKLRGKNAELVSEYVKKWAWRRWIPTGYDDLYIFGKQLNAESSLYGKVDYIVTDSPIYLASFYEDMYYPGRELVKPTLFKVLDHTKQNGIDRHNYWLIRRKEYNPAGRYQTEDEAKQIDSKLEDWLVSNQVPFEDIRVADRDRARLIADLSIGKHEYKDVKPIGTTIQTRL